MKASSLEHDSYGEVIDFELFTAQAAAGLHTTIEDFAKFAFRVFDENFKKLWEKEVTLPFKDRLFETTNYRIDNDGNVYLSGKLYHGSVRDRRGGKPNYQYIILAYRNNGADVKQYKVNLGDDFINELTYRISTMSPSVEPHSFHCRARVRPRRWLGEAPPL